MNKYNIFWVCPKCAFNNPGLRWRPVSVIGGNGYQLEVTCWKCGYYELMHTLDYEEESSDTI